MKIIYESGMRFIAETRGHRITADLPAEKGGTDQGMTPPELLAASLGTCIGVYVVSYCQSVGIDTTGLTVDVQSEMAASPARVGQMHAVVTVPGGIPEDRRSAVMKVAHNCLIHQTLCNMPDMTIELK